MKRVIIPLEKDDDGRIVYPDPDMANWRGSYRLGNNIVAEYLGEETLPSYTGQWPPPAESRPKLPITVTSIQGALSHKADFTEYEAYENDSVTIIGKIPLADKNFRMPVKRTDGRTIFIKMGVDSEGIFLLNIAVPESGEWVVDEKLLNEVTNQPFAWSFKGIRAFILRV